MVFFISATKLRGLAESLVEKIQNLLLKKNQPLLLFSREDHFRHAACKLDGEKSHCTRNIEF